MYILKTATDPDDFLVTKQFTILKNLEVNNITQNSMFLKQVCIREHQAYSDIANSLLTPQLSCFSATRNVTMLHFRSPVVLTIQAEVIGEQYPIELYT